MVMVQANKTGGYPQMKEGKKERWVVCECEYDVREKGSPTYVHPPRKAPKAVDEDLYKISPDLLNAKSKRVCILYNVFL